jgi:hypothetical protein
MNGPETPPDELPLVPTEDSDSSELLPPGAREEDDIATEHIEWGDPRALSNRRRDIWRLAVHSALPEAREVWKLAWPTLLTLLLQQLLGVVNIFFVGHLWTQALDATGLAVSFSNIFGVSIGFGLSSAASTLGSQVKNRGQWSCTFV